MKIEGLVQKTQNGLFGALGPPGWSEPGGPDWGKKKNIARQLPEVPTCQF